MNLTEQVLDLTWHLRALARYSDRKEAELVSLQKDYEGLRGPFFDVLREMAMNYWRLGKESKLASQEKQPAPLYIRGLRRASELGMRIEDPEGTLILPGTGYIVVSHEASPEVPPDRYFVCHTIEPRIWFHDTRLTTGQIAIKVCESLPTRPN